MIHIEIGYDSGGKGQESEHLGNALVSSAPMTCKTKRIQLVWGLDFYQLTCKIFSSCPAQSLLLSAISKRLLRESFFLLRYRCQERSIVFVAVPSNWSQSSVPLSDGISRTASPCLPLSLSAVVEFLGYFMIVCL